MIYCEECGILFDGDYCPKCGAVHVDYEEFSPEDYISTCKEEKKVYST